MMNAGNKKLLVLLLTLAMLACGVMALGGTLATGIDSANSQMEYEIDLLCYDPDTNEYKPLFGTQAYAPFADVVWCPGYTKILYLQVTNNEKFPVDYQLNLEVELTEFGDVMKYAMIHEDLKASTANHPSSWTAFAGNNAKPLSKESHELLPSPTATNRPTNSTEEGKLTSTNLNPSETHHVALAIHMEETANNDYQGKKMLLNFEFTVNSDYEPDYDPTSVPAND